MFRSVFGLCTAIELFTYLYRGWVNALFIQPRFHFTYLGFEWVKPLGDTGVYAAFILAIAASLGLAAGFLQRLSSLIFTITFVYIFLIDQCNYLNHWYLIALLGALLTVVPGSSELSLDRVWFREKPTVRRWHLSLLRFQVAVVYIFGGVAKINPDWIRGEPVRTWFATQFTLSPLHSLLQSEAVVLVVCVGGLLFDLCIIPLLMWSRTRGIAFFVSVAFHLTNAVLWDIGIFPWLMIGANLLYLPPDWPRRVLPSWLFSMSSAHGQDISASRRFVVMVFLASYVSVQIIVPLRHWFISGNVAWTYEGHRFSWRMKLIDMQVSLGIRVKQAEKDEIASIDVQRFLTDRQIRKFAGIPDMVLQFAHHVNNVAKAEGWGPVEVYADTMVSLNARPFRHQIDPAVNLAAQPRSIGHAQWILPGPVSAGWSWESAASDASR